MGKKIVDVEDLLIWAASELARKRPGRAAARPAFDLSRADRELVGRWTRPMGIPSVQPMFAVGLGKSGGAPGAPPHGDALRVGEALDRLAKLSPPCTTNRADLVAGLGFPVDIAGSLRAALANAANLLIVHGRLANRPIVRCEPPEPSAKLAPNGQPGVWRREAWVDPTFGDHAQAQRDAVVAVKAIRKDCYPGGAYGVLEWSPDPQELTNERCEYAAWRAGLEWLAAELAGELETRAALPPRAAARPWLGERDGELVRDLFAPGAEGVYAGADAASLAASRAIGRRRPIAGGRIYGRAPAKPAKGAREA